MFLRRALPWSLLLAALAGCAPGGAAGSAGAPAAAAARPAGATGSSGPPGVTDGASDGATVDPGPIGVPVEASGSSVAGSGGRAGRGSPAGVSDHGFRLEMPLPRPHFTLVDTRARPYDFGSRTAGRATLLYFGYTNCPDQCPTTLATIAEALRRLPAAVRSKVAVVFVTTDPARDTPAVMAEYLNRFDPSFVGLSGPVDAVVRAQRAAQVPVSTPAATETAKARPASTAHGGGALVYGRDDYARYTYPAGTSVQDLVADLPGLVNGPLPHAGATHG